MKRVTTCLWFKDQAEEAARYYVSLFRKSRLGPIVRYGAAGAKESGRPKGSVMTASFTLNGQRFMALNGGPAFKLSPAVSLIVPCRTQREIDRYWHALSRGGRKSVCGWLQDRFGLSWQIVPESIERMLNDRNPARSERVMAAVVTMTKLDLRKLQRAYAGD